MDRSDADRAQRILSRTADFQAVFSSEAGKRVLRYLMRRTGFLGTSFVAGDAYESAFNEGQRAIVVDICKKMKMDLKQLESELLRKGESDDDI